MNPGLEQEALKDLSRILELGKADLVSFRSLFLPCDEATEKEPAPFHYQFSEILLAGEDNFAIEAYRESGKTEYVIRSFCLYCLRYPSAARDFIVLIKATATLAGAKLKEIETEYLTNPLLNSNLVKVQEQSTQVFSVDVRDDNDQIINVRFEAFGKGASFRGLSNMARRPKIAIIDDPQDTEDSRSEVVQEADFRWFLSDVTFLGEACRLFLIGNNLGARCIIERIIAEAPNLEKIKFTTMRIPILDKDGNPTWPDGQTKDKIEKEREDFRKLGQIEIWYREKMCLSVNEETQQFRRQDFQYYAPNTAQKIAASCNVFIRTDLAISEKKSADYSVIAVGGINEDNYLFMFDVIYGRFDPSTFMDLLFQSVTRYKPMNVGLEKIAYQAALQHFLQKEMSRRNIWFNIVEQKADTQKEIRIATLQPRFRAHTIFFPEEASWLAEAESQFLMFPKAAHDDIPDAMAGFMNDTSQPFGKLSPANLPREAESGYNPHQHR